MQHIQLGTHHTFFHHVALQAPATRTPLVHLALREPGHLVSTPNLGKHVVVLAFSCAALYLWQLKQLQ